MRGSENYWIVRFNTCLLVHEKYIETTSPTLLEVSDVRDVLCVCMSYVSFSNFALFCFVSLSSRFILRSRFVSFYHTLDRNTALTDEDVDVAQSKKAL